MEAAFPGPNMVLIIIDGLRAENLSCYGYSKVTSPYMDKIADEGVLFENAFSCSDETYPSFTTIFTGKYPLSHGIIHHSEKIKPEELNELKLTGTLFLPEILRSHGYFTIGLDWLGRWLKRGYDVYTEPVELFKRRFLIPHIHINRALLKFLNLLPLEMYNNVSRALAPYGLRFGLAGYLNILATDTILSQATTKMKSKFFLTLHFWDVHTPLDAIPRAYIRKFYAPSKGEPVREMIQRIKNERWKKLVVDYHLKGIKYVDEIPHYYNGAIAYVDHFISEFFQLLKKINLLENTYIIITADHGDNHMRHGIFVGHGGPYERVMHVPLIFYGLDLPRGRRINEFVQHVDLAPTILELLGIDYHQYDFDGKSLCNLIRQRECCKWRDAIYFVCSTTKRRYAIRTRRYKYIYSASKADSMDIYDGIWANDVVELYDLHTDPLEIKNIVHSKPELAEKLKAQLLDWIHRTKLKREKTILRRSISKLLVKSKLKI